MKTIDVTIVRIYITESSGMLKQLLTYLKREAKIRGVSVFRAISGFGESGDIHTTALVDLSLNLPLIVEFFDTHDKIDLALDYLAKIIRPEHIVFWQAKGNL